MRSAFAQTPQNCKFIWQDVDESADYFDPKFFGQTKECLGTLLENIGRRNSENPSFVVRSGPVMLLCTRPITLDLPSGNLT